MTWLSQSNLCVLSVLSNLADYLLFAITTLEPFNSNSWYTKIENTHKQTNTHHTVIVWGSAIESTQHYAMSDPMLLAFINVLAITVPRTQNLTRRLEFINYHIYVLFRSQRLSVFGKGDCVKATAVPEWREWKNRINECIANVEIVCRTSVHNTEFTYVLIRMDLWIVNPLCGWIKLIYELRMEYCGNISSCYGQSLLLRWQIVKSVIRTSNTDSNMWIPNWSGFLIACSSHHTAIAV